MIKYNTTGSPTKSGVYACRIYHPDDPTGFLLKDEFLLYYEENWSYLGSDMNYRDKVLGWIGPLQRKL